MWLVNGCVVGLFVVQSSLKKIVNIFFVCYYCKGGFSMLM